MDLGLSKCLGQVKLCHQMKMLHECRATQLLCVTWEEQFNDGIHFQFWPHERSNLGQNRLN